MTEKTKEQLNSLLSKIQGYVLELETMSPIREEIKVNIPPYLRDVLFEHFDSTLWIWNVDKVKGENIKLFGARVDFTHFADEIVVYNIHRFGDNEFVKIIPLKEEIKIKPIKKIDKLTRWLDLNVFWIFVNGRKEEEYYKRMKKKYKDSL